MNLHGYLRFLHHPLSHPNPVIHHPAPHHPRAYSLPVPPSSSSDFPKGVFAIQHAALNLLDPIGKIYLFYLVWRLLWTFIDPRRYRGVRLRPWPYCAAAAVLYLVLAGGGGLFDSEEVMMAQKRQDLVLRRPRDGYHATAVGQEIVVEHWDKAVTVAVEISKVLVLAEVVWWVWGKGWRAVGEWKKRKEMEREMRGKRENRDGNEGEEGGEEVERMRDVLMEKWTSRKIKTQPWNVKRRRGGIKQAD